MGLFSSLHFRAGQVYLSICQFLRSVSGSQPGVILHPRDIWQRVETFLVVTPGLGVGSECSATGVWWGETGMLLNTLQHAEDTSALLPV